MPAVRLALLLPVLLVPALFVLANPEPPTSGYNPPLVKASDDAVKAIPRFQIDKSLKVEVWAAEPMLTHPVAFAFDEKGVCYVAETFRHSRGVTDNRSHMNWLDDELALRTVAERVELYKKDAKGKFAATYEKERDRVRRLEDTTGSGRADRSTVFRDDFGSAADGIGAGLLARKGNVYFTCIPDVWLLKDTKNTGVADSKKSLSTGYGVHTAFIGHDLHGLRVGMDGRLYFSIGDRGLNVKTKEGKHLYLPDTGAVLRCELDGTNLEIFATGLRNPQELAFDDYGNLFTVDNNSDSGDQARFVHVVEGGDSGWRIGYQYESAMHDETVKQGNRGPWNYEQLWTPGATPAYVLPPLKNFSNGPSGFTAYPGLGLSDKYKGHFFLANFSGSTGNSGIFSFTTKPKGASFEMVGDHKFMWTILSTDVDFGPDSAMYVSDWVDGWDINGKGRMYKITDPEAAKNPAIAEAKKLLAEGVEKKSAEELIALLGHPHRDVRLEAQFALREMRAYRHLVALATDTTADRLRRCHAIWALRPKDKKWMDDADASGAIGTVQMRLLMDRDEEVRVQAMRLLADAGAVPTAGNPHPLDLLDAAQPPRVRAEAALTLASYKLSAEGSRTGMVRNRVVEMLRDNDDKDPYLRHAGAEALAKCVTAKVLVESTNDKSVAVRLAVVVALRRQKAVEVAAFLDDSDPKVVAEATRAINDELITAAMPKLAALISKPDLPRVTAYRVLNAHYLLGKKENADALAAYAVRSDAPPPLRGLAVKMLGEWAKPPRRDYITGLTQSLPDRSAEEAKTALTAVIGKVFAGPPALRKSATTAVTKLGIKEVGPFLLALVADEAAEAGNRVEALDALVALKDSKLGDAAKSALAAKDPRVRSAGRGVLIVNDPKGALAQFRTILAGSDTVEQQGSLALLAKHPSVDADALVGEQLDKMIAKTAKPELWLEITEAAKASKSELIKTRLANLQANPAKGDDIAPWRATLAGGDAAKGKQIFLSNTALQCQRCHQLDKQGGEVGPPMNGLGKQPREYLLEAIVLPNKAIAKGYDTILITTNDLKTVSGVLKSETADEIQLMTAEAKLVKVRKADIDDRRTTKSAMPDDLHGKMSLRELRDLVEFLSTLK